MYRLSVDTSTQNLSYSIHKGSRLIYEYNCLVQRGSSQLAGHLHKTLKKFSLGVKDFDSFYVGAGPGSFTGLRISFSLIKAFVLVAKKPYFCLNSFFTCAYPLRKKAGKIAVVADAKRGLLYVSFFLSGQKGFWQKTMPKLIEAKDCIKQSRDFLLVTYEDQLRSRLLKENSKLKIWPQNVYPKAKYLIEAAGKGKIKKGTYNLSGLQPLYLHPLSCQVKKGNI